MVEGEEEQKPVEEKEETLPGLLGELYTTISKYQLEGMEPTDILKLIAPIVGYIGYSLHKIPEYYPEKLRESMWSLYEKARGLASVAYETGKAEGKEHVDLTETLYKPFKELVETVGHMYQIIQEFESYKYKKPSLQTLQVAIVGLISSISLGYILLVQRTSTMRLVNPSTVNFPVVIGLITIVAISLMMLFKDKMPFK